MNILSYIALFPALGWLALYLFTGTRSDTLLGFTVIVVLAWAVPMAWLAIKEDQEILGG